MPEINKHIWHFYYGFHWFMMKRSFSTATFFYTKRKPVRLQRMRWTTLKWRKIIPPQSIPPPFTTPLFNLLNYNLAHSIVLLIYFKMNLITAILICSEINFHYILEFVVVWEMEFLWLIRKVLAVALTTVEAQIVGVNLTFIMYCLWLYYFFI